MASPAPPQTARSIGILFNDVLLKRKNINHCAPGDTNSILDVASVCVGHANYLSGSYYINNSLQTVAPAPPGDVNSGVTAILPLGFMGSSSRRSRLSNNNGNAFNTFVPAGFFSLNGCGEMTGIHWVEEWGLLQGPIMLSNTVNVGAVRSEVINYWYQSNTTKPQIDDAPLLPVVAETDDSWLSNVMNPFGTSKVLDFGAVAKDAIDNALARSDTKTTPLAQGNCGGGTGMTCYDWKGGIGTASRVVQLDVPAPRKGSKPLQDTFTVGVLVQANQGNWNELTILGVPVGPIDRFKPDCCPEGASNCSCSPDSVSECALGSSASSGKKARGGRRRRSAIAPNGPGRKRKSSIIVVIATDAPLMPHQLKRLARRGALGIARTGTSSHDDSGELCIAFSTALQDGYNGYFQQGKIAPDMWFLPNDVISPCLFTAVVEATEEAIINALVAAEDLSYVTPSGCTHMGCAIAGTNTWPMLKSYLKNCGRA